MTTIFKQYRDIKDKIAELEAKKDELELQVIDEMDADSIRDKQTEWGHFFIGGRKTWEYSKAIVDMQEQIRRQKKVEEYDGTALLVKDSQYVRLIIPKE